MAIDVSLDDIREYTDRYNIRRLRADYAHCIDAAEWEVFGSLFTEDAVVTYSFGAFEGREAIIENVSERVDYEFSVHTAQMPRLDVGRNSATGVWYFIVYAVPRGGDESWIFGRYLDEYRRVDGEWKFRTSKPKYATRRAGRSREDGETTVWIVTATQYFTMVKQVN